MGGRGSRRAAKRENAQGELRFGRSLTLPSDLLKYALCNHSAEAWRQASVGVEISAEPLRATLDH